MSRTSAVKFTYQDYLRLPDGRRYEVIDGSLFVTPAPSYYHQIVLAHLMFALMRHTREHALGEIVSAPCDVVLSQTDVVQPDLLYISKQRGGIVGEKYVSAAPDLAIEILSESTAQRDRGIKSKMYERFGLAELWIVDPWAKTIEIFRGSEGRLAPHSVFGSTDSLVTPTFPGLEIPLLEVF